jgi:hypothetical protein
LNYRTVAEGDIVKAGQQIGGVGDKGFATTPHLHFQIDTEDAPWHPYWPFSSKEASDAGLSFVEAVNEGLGKENLDKYTIDPMDFIQKYLKDKTSASYEVKENLENKEAENQELVEETVHNANEEDDTQLNQNDENIDQIPVTIETEEIVSNNNEAVSLKLETENYYPEKKQAIKVCAFDEDGVLTERPPVNGISLELVQGKGEFSKEKLNSKDFFLGCGKIDFSPSIDNTGKIVIFAHDPLNFIKGSIEIEKFTFKDLDGSFKDFDAVDYAFKNNITTGYPDGTFKPYNEVKRIEAVAFILRALKWEPIQNPKFDLPDASDKDWYSGLLAKAMEADMVKGYPDGTVKLENTVNGAEFLKMFITAFAKVDEADQNAEWYEKFKKYAVDNGLIDEKFNVNGSLDRATVIEVIYKAKDLI